MRLLLKVPMYPLDFSKANEPNVSIPKRADPLMESLVSPITSLSLETC